MSGSAAEERIRTKAEAFLRAAYPQARIIHELVVVQGGERIDLAAVTADVVVLLEVKSERDVLARLPAQAKAAGRVADAFAVCAAERYAGEIEHLGARYLPDLVPLVRKGLEVGQTYAPNPDHIAELHGVEVLHETTEGFAAAHFGSHRIETASPKILNPRHRLEMLWAAELQWLAAAMGADTRWSRSRCIEAICELATGREIRRGVCAALRARPFPRADEPIPLTAPIIGVTRRAEVLL